MSFNAQSLEFIGGAPELGLWRYRTEDNLASQEVGALNTTYFKGPSTALTYLTHRVRAGDVIIASCGANDDYSINVNSGVVHYIVPQNWDANGASVIPTAFSISEITKGQGGD